MLASLLPRKILSSRYRWAWLVFLLLAPLAYGIGVRLLLRTNHNAHAAIALNRSEFIAKAAQYAGQLNVNVAGWSSFLNLTTDDELFFYERVRQSPANAPAFQHLTPIVVKVAFRNPTLTEAIEILMRVNGQAFGFQRFNVRAKSETVQPEPETRQLAETALRQRPEAALIPAGWVPLLEERSENGALQRKYKWKWEVPNAPELLAETILTVQDGQVIAAEIQSRIRKDANTAFLREWTPLKIAGVIIYWLMVVVFAIFGIFRFVKRAQEKEISTGRVVGVATFVALVTTSFIILTDVASYDMSLRLQGRNVELIILATSLFIFGLMGALFGLAYGSGEGDIREAYPGKLTSLDALITGRVFSANVGRSFIWGAAWAGWLVLANMLVHLFWHRNPATGDEFYPLVMALSRSPFLSFLLSWQGGVIQMLVLSLLLPLPWLRRTFKSDKVILPLLLLIAWIASQNPEIPYRPWSAVMVYGVLFAVVIITSFLKFDLLTAGSAIGLSSFTQFVWVLYAQPAPSLHRQAVALIASVSGLLIVATVCLFRGRKYTEEEVRPVYAKNLAERLSLQADVSAARVAQERLLPQSLPASSRFTVAASCVPAHEVGGDFFDFFEPDGERLGVLVAEGGGLGLGSALTIAFAKGFLMPKLTAQGKNSSRDDSPAESMRALQTRMNLMLDRDAVAEQNIGLAYAELDTTDGVLRYARTGSYPQALLVRQHAEQAETIAETVLRFASPQPDEPPIELREGRANLEPGDCLILFTGGIAEAWKEKKQIPAEILPKLLRHQSGEKIQHALNEEIGHCSDFVRKHGLEDDLTAVIIRLEAHHETTLDTLTLDTSTLTSEAPHA